MEEDNAAESIRKHIRELFILNDQQNSGQITINDLSSFLSSLGMALSDKELAEAVKTVDPLNTTFFKPNDVERYAISRLSKFTIEDFMKHMATFDFDKDGKISMEDFEGAMTTFGNLLTDEELDAIKKENKTDTIDIKLFAEKLIKY